MKDGLYEFKKRSQSCFAALHSKERKNRTENSAVNYPSSILVKEKWHRKLGHPSDKVLSQVLQLCNIKMSSNENFFCESC